MPFYNSALPLHILFIFLDGIGLGAKNKKYNPFCQFNFSSFHDLAGGQPWTYDFSNIEKRDLVCKGIDATLQIDGLPQSGTGQATLFTGINCAKLAGRHFGPYPHSKTKSAIANKNIFQQVKHLQLAHPEPTAFANAYPERFFENARSSNRWTVTTLSCIKAEVRIRTLEELRKNGAIAADLTRQAWRSKLELQVDVIREDQAADHLHMISLSHPFTLFEYYLTDKAGHSQSMASAFDVLSSLDVLFSRLLHVLDFDRTLLLITSDHGNLEDLSIKSHTMNEVPFIAHGNGAHFFKDVSSILDVSPAILSAMRQINLNN